MLRFGVSRCLKPQNTVSYQPPPTAYNVQFLKVIISLPHPLEGTCTPVGEVSFAEAPVVREDDDVQLAANLQRVLSESSPPTCLARPNGVAGLARVVVGCCLNWLNSLSNWGRCRFWFLASCLFTTRAKKQKQVSCKSKEFAFLSNAVVGYGIVSHG